MEKTLTDLSDAWRASLQSSTMAVRPIRSPAAVRVPVLTVLAHPDAARIGERRTLPELASGRATELSRLAPDFAAPGSDAVPRPLSDPHLSRRPLRFEPVAAAVRILRAGCGSDCRVDGAALEAEHVVAPERLEHGVVILVAARVALLLHTARPVAERQPRHFGLRGDSDAIAALRRELSRAADLEAAVLLRGETGTGKELAARALHDAGRRSAGPFVALNMAAVPCTLAAAELFGAARGAFSGAERHREGYFRRAEGGTLFLDEIGAAPGEIQDLLLRALESGEIQPVGASSPRRVDVRVVAATDVDLGAAIAAGTFRPPLFHRLAGCEIELPPLRRRRDDVARLLVSFLRAELEALGAAVKLVDPGPHGVPWLPAALVARLVAFDWPGNVRQLKNVARRLAASGHDRRQACFDPALERELSATTTSVTATSATAIDATTTAQMPATKPVPRPPRSRTRYRPPGEIDDDELLAALAAHRWRPLPTAGALGVSRTSLYGLIERCPSIRKASQLGRDEIAAALERAGGDADEAAAALEVSPQGLRLRIRELGLR